MARPGWRASGCILSCKCGQLKLVKVLMDCRPVKSSMQGSCHLLCSRLSHCLCVIAAGTRSMSIPDVETQNIAKSLCGFDRCHCTHILCYVMFRLKTSTAGNFLQRLEGPASSPSAARRIRKSPICRPCSCQPALSDPPHLLVHPSEPAGRQRQSSHPCPCQTSGRTCA